MSALGLAIGLGSVAALVLAFVYADDLADGNIGGGEDR